MINITTDMPIQRLSPDMTLPEGDSRKMITLQANTCIEYCK